MKELMADSFKKPQTTNTPDFLGKLIYWCFRWGCEVELRNMAYNTPVMQQTNLYRMGDNHEVQPNGDIVDMAHRTKHVVIEMPQLRFKKGDRHIEIMGHSWEDLILRVKHEHRKIFAELSVPYFDINKDQ